MNFVKKEGGRYFLGKDLNHNTTSQVQISEDDFDRHVKNGMTVRNNLVLSNQPKDGKVSKNSGTGFNTTGIEESIFNHDETPLEAPKMDFSNRDKSESRQTTSKPVNNPGGKEEALPLPSMKF